MTDVGRLSPIKAARFMSPNSVSVVPPVVGGQVLPDAEQSDLYKQIVGKNEYAPLLKSDKAWTKCAPYKEQKHFRTPSESIGNNFRPTAQDLKIEAIPPSGRTSVSPKKMGAKKKSLPALLQAPAPAAAVDGGDYGDAAAVSELAQAMSGFHFNEASSRPTSPQAQLNTIAMENAVADSDMPTKRDVARFVHYYETGIPTDDLPQFDECMLQLVPSTGGTETRPVQENVRSRLPEELVNDPDYQPLLEELTGEVTASYLQSQKLSILNYVLKDPAERKRLQVENVPHPFETQTVRAPVPWHQAAGIAAAFLENELFITNPIMLQLLELWEVDCGYRRFADTDELEDLRPMTVKRFAASIASNCDRTRDFFEQQWIGSVVRVIMDNKEEWMEYVMESDATIGGYEHLEHLFQCVSTMMTNNMRFSVRESLNDLCDFMEPYGDGNDFGEEYQDLQFTRPQLITLQLEADGDGNVIHKPSLEDVATALRESCEHIVTAAVGLPRVENKIFANSDSQIPEEQQFLKCGGLEDESNFNAQERLRKVLLANETGANNYLKLYVKYKYLLRTKTSISEAELEVETFLSAENQELASYKAYILRMQAVKTEIMALRANVPLNLIALDARKLHVHLAAEAEKLIAILIKSVVDLSRKLNRSIDEQFNKIANRLMEKPVTSQDMVDLEEFLKVTKTETIFALDKLIIVAKENIQFLMQYATLSSEDVKLNTTTVRWPKKLEPLFDITERKVDESRNAGEVALKKKIDDFGKTLDRYMEEVEQFTEKSDPLRADTIATNCGFLDTMVEQLATARELADAIDIEEGLLEFNKSNFMPQIQLIESTMTPYKLLWGTSKKWYDGTKSWLDGEFLSLDAEVIADDVQMMYRTAFKLSKQFGEKRGPLKTANLLKGKIDKFKADLPLVMTLCNKGMRERHWEEISELTGYDIQPDEETKLNDLLNLNLNKHMEKMEAIGAAASKEYGLEKAMIEMKAGWSDTEFTFAPYRDTGISVLSGLDDIQLLLDDHIVKAQTMRGSPFIGPFKGPIEDWATKLISMQDILDEWLKVQATWMYLEPIFSSEDIMAQMPEEGRKFTTVDKNWKAIMTKSVEDTRALVVTDQPNMLDTLKNANVLLEAIQKGLNKYLEVKRLFFPRFFFLSNDELLEILSETKDPTKVQPHLRKCFEGIAKLRFDEEQKIHSMISAEGEEVELDKVLIPADAHGMVEKWLNEVLQYMIISVRSRTLGGVEDYAKTPRKEFVKKWPGMVIISVCSIYWTEAVEEAIETPGGLDAYGIMCTDNINDIVEMVRGKLEKATRTSLSALTVIDVHARDVVVELADAKVKTLNDFKWIAQLRYYWEKHAISDKPDQDDVVVKMITTPLMYGYEYLGNSGRLVITPLTDRCYRTLMGALALDLGGAPEGPAGTGKTETSKDLAKAVAKQCVVFNCSDGLDYKAMGKFFKGVAQAGAWACFDEFNRIELEVLSVVAQQVHSITMAKKRRVKTFMFEGTELVLDRSCMMFITMNPGYAGRSDLPDNLKVLFRTVAMMVPDYGLIGEILLYSMGFVNARVLANKIVAVYRLCSEQLSSQSHYDYGMRAVKAVLTCAGNLKLQYPEEDEYILMLRSIVDVNLAKFLAHDVPLFKGITSDLFPGITLPPPDYETIRASLLEQFAKRKLQPTEYAISKIFQVYEIMLVRHGFMIVGDALAGKTSAWKLLSDTLGDLEEKGLWEDAHKVWTIEINPKSMTMDQLYGSFDPTSHEWSDGVLANSYRDLAVAVTQADGSPDLRRKWLLFDGPVDAIWIENMNTVLDDNKKLCLMSGEIMAMNNEMSVMFEPEDLLVASPATVSRVGMIYLEPARLGWRPFYTSWKQSLPEALSTEEVTAQLDELFEWAMDPIVNYVRLQLKEFVPTSVVHKVKQMLDLFDCLIDNWRGGDIPSAANTTSWLESLFVFACAWSLGSNMPQVERLKLEEFVRALLGGTNEEFPKPKTQKFAKQQMPPERGTIFDFMFNAEQGTWVSWLDMIKVEEIPANAKADTLIIATSETTRQKYFLDLFVQRSRPVLFVGPTGTGKSAVVNDELLKLPKDKFVPVNVNFSAQTSAKQVQDIVLSKLDRRRKGVLGPQMGKRCVLFVDDLNMPMKEEYGAQPPIELLRQLNDYSYWYDHKDTSRINLVDIDMVAAMGPPGGGRNHITARFVRWFNIIGIDSFEESTMTRIFSAIMSWHFSKGYDSSFGVLGSKLVSATAETYALAMEKLLPTPAKSHYLFNLRDFARVIQGVMLVPPDCLQDGDKVIRLWIHEVYRVFYDRLTDAGDRGIFFDVVNGVCQNAFKKDFNKIFPHLLNEGATEIVDDNLRSLFFGDYMVPGADPRKYDEVQDMDGLKTRMEEALSEYNMLSKEPMSLVMFRFAIEHVSRVCRVIKQANGHVLLVGMGGSGRQSSVKMAAAMGEYEMFRIELTKNYSRSDWFDDIRKMHRLSGYDGKPTCFLFADNQIKEEAMLEDINMLLNTGDVPNLYEAEDKAEICEKMMAVVKDQRLEVADTGPLAMYNMFIQRVRANLHICLSMSYIGDAFRTRLRQFPSLVNCCTIDWFQPWPADALVMVAETFLKEVELEPRVRTEVVAMCQHFHNSVMETSAEFLNILRRHYYITPTSYLELIQTFKALLQMKRDEILGLKGRYEGGLEKLDFAAQQVAVMQEELTALQPKLVVTSKEVEIKMEQIAKDTVEVDAKKAIVAVDEKTAADAAAAANEIKESCEADLAVAMPALDAAISALNTLKPSDIGEVKAMTNPPAAVRMVMEAVCVMKGVKHEKIKDKEGNTILDFWGPSKKLLSDMKFLQSLKDYDKDNIPEKVIKQIRKKFTVDPDFKPEIVKKSSVACMGICSWVCAMEVYERVAKVVAPKKAKLAESMAELAVQTELLQVKQAELKAVLDKLQALNDELAAMVAKKEELAANIKLCGEKLIRAEELIGGLGGEKVRWGQTAEDLGVLYTKVTGDVLLSSGLVAYLGAFTLAFRNSCLEDWAKQCEEREIPTSANYSLASTLGQPVLIRDWHIAGLPVDSFSTDNGIIVDKSRRWPLMIDPQGQANKWVKNMEKDNKLGIIKLSDANFVRTIENSVQFGTPVLLENVGEELDPILEPLLLKTIFKQGGVDYMKVGENIVEYSPDFRFYITSRLRNPHYMPEIAVKVTLVNFMITPEGLQDQLLSIVAAQERPDLEEAKNKLVLESASNKRQLKEIEDKILKVLSSSEGNILEDESAIKVLSSSKILSTEIAEKQVIADETSKEIDATRAGYLPVSIHGSIVFFCIADLANIDSMYQYSLIWFTNLYIKSIKDSEKAEDLDTRIKNINDHFTYSIYRNVCRSLFEKDKLLFSFLLCIGLMKGNGKIDDSEWRFLLTGGVGTGKDVPNPAPGWFPDARWGEITRACELPSFDGFESSFAENIEGWKALYDSATPYSDSFPAPWDEKLTALQKLIALRLVRPDKITPKVVEFVTGNIGTKYTEPPPFDLAGAFADSDCCSALVFVLSTGSDPMAALQAFADTKGMGAEKTQSISLGQGQGPIAEEMIKKAMKEGTWVVLQNCHLSTTWMPRLEFLTEEWMVPQDTHENFRLWLTSYPSKDFPVSILQNGVKMTNEPPKGLRANIYRSYINDPIADQTFFEDSNKPKRWEKMIFALSFFHAVIQERRQFGPLGFNIPYGFDDSDLRISIRQMQMFVNDYDDLPLEALTYCVGQCNYGGRVTDDWDRRCLMSLLSIYFNDTIVGSDDYKFSPSGTYFAPPKGDFESYKTYIKSLPAIPHPEVFGMHANADISKDQKETNELFNSILLTLPRQAGGVGKGPNEIVDEMCESILSEVPEEFNTELVAERFPVLYEESMNTVLGQECVRFNRLIKVVRSTLKDIRKAIVGLVVMSTELEGIFNSMLIGKIPGAWLKSSYPSLKPLGGYVKDFVRRLTFLGTWIDNGKPATYWLSGFFFTQAFLTGARQNYARAKGVAIDLLVFDFTVTKTEGDAPETIAEEPAIGVYVYGLFMEGMKWDRESMQLGESAPKVLYDILPVMLLEPVLNKDAKKEPHFVTPVYKTTERKGVLATTGHSSNFVMDILLPSDKPESHWINRGAALICGLDD